MKDNYRDGVIVTGIKTPIIKPKDDLQKIVISAVADLNEGKFDDGDIIGVKEAVLAITQSNFVTQQDISDDVLCKFRGAEKLAIVDPIQSRNRILAILNAIAQIPTLKKVYVVMTYPTDEVGNRLVADEDIKKGLIESNGDILTEDEFYERIGKPKHTFTGLDYVKEYKSVSARKVEIIFCNVFQQLPVALECEHFLVCSIHRKEQTKKILKEHGAKHILDLSQIMNKSLEGSGYNPEYGLYGSSLMSEAKLKLLPRDCQEFVEDIQNQIFGKYKKRVEVFLFGDGAFKDPVGGIWELADPQSTLAATDGLKGTPEEVKLKYIASCNEKKTSEEIQEVVAKKKQKLRKEGISDFSSLGTTPRRTIDLLASLADLTTGSGDRQTPVVYIKNYLNN